MWDGKRGEVVVVMVVLCITLYILEAGVFSSFKFFFTFCIFALSIHNLLLYDAGAPRFQTVHGDMNGLCDEFAY